MTDFLIAIITVLLGGITYFIKKMFDELQELKNDFKPIVPAIVEIQGKFQESGYTILFPLTIKPGSPLKTALT